MSDKRDKEKLAEAFREIAWMAIRYANGRKTYAPSTVRRAVKLYQEVYPDWEPKFDKTLLHDKQHVFKGENFFKGDWLDDLMASPEEVK